MFMTEQVFVDIDTQCDFISQHAALSVPGAGELRPNLKLFDRLCMKTGIKIFACADAHFPDDKAFELFPLHCVRKTPGQKKIAETTAANTVVIKNNAAELKPDELLIRTNRFCWRNKATMYSPIQVLLRSSMPLKQMNTLSMA